eukprot:7181769-Prymnesium_polylepis.1
MARDRVQPPRKRLPGHVRFNESCHVPGLVGRIPANRCIWVAFPEALVPMVARGPALSVRA